MTHEADRYFKSPADRIVFALLVLSGTPRLELLDVTIKHYRHTNIAVRWHEEMRAAILTHPEADVALQQLYDMFSRMTRTGRTLTKRKIAERKAAGLTWDE